MSEIPLPLFTNISLHRPEVVRARTLESGSLAVTLGRKDDEYDRVRADLFFNDDGLLEFVVDLVNAVDDERFDFRNDVLDALRPFVGGGVANRNTTIMPKQDWE